MANDTTADLIVMPRCRSSARESVWVLPASTLPTASITPAAYSSRSVRLVLPASTCARIPRFSTSTQLHVLRTGRSHFHARHEARSHDGLLSITCSRYCPEYTNSAPHRTNHL